MARHAHRGVLARRTTRWHQRDVAELAAASAPITVTAHLTVIPSRWRQAPPRLSLTAKGDSGYAITFLDDSHDDPEPDDPPSDEDHASGSDSSSMPALASDSGSSDNGDWSPRLRRPYADSITTAQISSADHLIPNNCASP